MFGEFTPLFNLVAPFIALILIGLIMGSIGKNIKISFDERFGNRIEEHPEIYKNSTKGSPLPALIFVIILVAIFISGIK